MIVGGQVLVKGRRQRFAGGYLLGLAAAEGEAEVLAAGERESEAVAIVQLFCGDEMERDLGADG